MLIKKKICLNYKFPYKIVLIANFLYEATNKDNEYALLIKQKVFPLQSTCYLHDSGQLIRKH